MREQKNSKYYLLCNFSARFFVAFPSDNDRNFEYLLLRLRLELVEKTAHDAEAIDRH